MDLILLLHFVFSLSNHVSSKDDLEEPMYNRSESIEEKMEELEKTLKTKNEEMKSLQNRLTEVEEMLSTQKKNLNKEIATIIKNECKVEVKKELDKVLPEAVEQSLRELPYEMVCAYQVNKPARLTIRLSFVCCLLSGRMARSKFSRQLRPNHGGIQQL